MIILRNGGHRDLERFYPLMEMDYDSEELLSKAELHSALLKHSVELLIQVDEESGTETGYAVTCPGGVYGYVLLKYMGVLPWYREKGIGVELMRLINKRYAEKQGIIAEITDFPDEDPNHQKKLAKFFARFGYVEVESRYYIGGTRAHIWVKPLKGTWDIASVSHRIIPEIYSRFVSGMKIRKMIDIAPVSK